VNKDLFGNDTTGEMITCTMGPYHRFKAANQYRHGDNHMNCGTCDNFTRRVGSDKVYFKCKLMGVSHSSASDILKSGVCDMWEKRDG